MNPVFPFVHAASTSIITSSTNRSGQSLINVGAANSPFRQPCLVTEIRVLAVSSVPPDAACVSQYETSPMAPYIRASMRLGGYDLTSGFIAPWTLGPWPLHGTQNEYKNYQRSVETLSWVFRRPAYVAPGESILVDLKFENEPLAKRAAAETFTVTVSVIGQTLGASLPAGSIRHIPFAVGYTSDRTTTAVRSGQALFNPLREPFYVDYMSGRLTGISGGTFREALGYDKATTLDIVDSYGVTVSGDRLRFYELFNPQLRALELHSKLAHGEGYSVNVYGKPANREVQLTLVGHREVGL